MLTLQSFENVVIGPVTCNGTEVLLRDCLRGQYNISITYSAMVAGLNLQYVDIHINIDIVVHFQSTR